MNEGISERMDRIEGVLLEYFRRLRIDPTPLVGDLIARLEAVIAAEKGEQPDAELPEVWPREIRGAYAALKLIIKGLRSGDADVPLALAAIRDAINIVRRERFAALEAERDEARRELAAKEAKP